MTKNAESLNVGVALSVMLYELVAGADGKSSVDDNERNS